jgi:hypothetical protein
MPDLQWFDKSQVDMAPDTHGVYALGIANELLYYGRAMGDGVTIKSRLQSHFRGDEGPCTQSAQYFKFEITEHAVQRESELLEAYRRQFGRLPQCNERSA